MPKITIWRKGLFQHAEIDNSSFSWKLVPPFRKAPNKLIDRQNGKMAKTAAAPNTSIAPLIMDEVDRFGRGLFLGFGTNFTHTPDNQTSWREGCMMNKEQIASLSRHKQPKFSSYNKFMWTTSPVVNTSNIWLGYFVSTNISIYAARAKAFVGVIWQLDKTNKMYLVVGDAGYACAGLGVSADVSIGIFTGFPSASKMTGYAKNEFGLSICLGSNFANLAKYVGKGSQVASKLGQSIDQVKNLKPLLTLLEDYGSFCEKRDRYVNGVKHTQTAYKVGSNENLVKALAKPAASMSKTEIVKLLLMSLGVDGSKRGMEFMQFSTGLELSAFGGSASINGVYPL